MRSLPLGVAKSALLDIINGQRQRFSVRELLAAAYAQEPNERPALFRILGEITDEAALPELLGRLQGKDQMARLHIINILSRFTKPEVHRALQHVSQRLQQDGPRCRAHRTV